MAPAIYNFKLERILIIEMFENYPDVVTVDDLTKMLGIGRNTAYRLVNEGEIKTLRIGRKILIPKCNIVNFINSPSHYVNMCYNSCVNSGLLNQ